MDPDTIAKFFANFAAYSGLTKALFGGAVAATVATFALLALGHLPDEPG